MEELSKWSGNFHYQNYRALRVAEFETSFLFLYNPKV